MAQFEHLGFFREYYIDGKYIGTKRCEKDRQEIGYIGRKWETTTAIVSLDFGRKIKKGVEIQTILYPLCGKKL